MDRIDLAGANLGDLIRQLDVGETIEIVQDGAKIAELHLTSKPAAPKPRRPIDTARLKALTDSLPYQEQSAGDFIRAMRDSDRY